MFGRKIINRQRDVNDMANIFDIDKMKLDDPKFNDNEKKFEYIDQIFQENFDNKKKPAFNKLNEKFEEKPNPKSKPKPQKPNDNIETNPPEEETKTSENIPSK